MHDFAHTSFHPDLLSTMEIALDSALAKLPHPVRSAHVTAIAESILRSASEGERDVRSFGDAGAPRASDKSASRISTSPN
jgi:hypothetical protein